MKILVSFIILLLVIIIGILLIPNIFNYIENFNIWFRLIVLTGGLGLLVWVLNSIKVDE